MAGNELATAYLALVPTLKGAKGAIERELDSANLRKVGEKEGEKLGDGLSKGAGFKMKGGLKNAAAAAAAVAAAAFAAAFNIGRQSLEAYADYEQLVGGIETLYKDSADSMMAYAAEAYKSAGMSANQYMELSTGFAASLIQSLDGDTSKAADYANMAITDMSDNANKMGTSMESIQNAYQGFAKQNYTMLDNLKLGYGGTKSEMERLLKDAEAISGIHYDISNYADIVEAIHVIQNEMGITGTTAEEAAKTISGSVGMAKAAWENWLVGLANEDSDMRQLTEDLFSSIGVAVENIMPRVKEVALTLLDVFGDMTGDMLLKGRDWMIGLGGGIKDGFKFVMSEIGRGISEGVQRIKDRVSDFIQAGKDLINGLIQGVKANEVGATGAIGEVGVAMLDKTKTTLGINSPSKKFMEIGQYSMEGMAIGIRNKAPNAVDAVNGVSRDMLGAASFRANASVSGGNAGGAMSKSEIYEAVYNAISDAMPNGLTLDGREFARWSKRSGVSVA